MNCFPCFGKKNPFIYPDYMMITPSIDIIQYCVICEKEIYKKAVYCKLCQVMIGHLSCVKTWLKKEKKCPYCKMDTEGIES